MQPISPEQGFIPLRRSGAVYVDKTEAILDLISYQRVFFSRPRRFGKSLTLSTIGTLFEKGVEPYFKGTWIYDRWSDGTYPVLRLNCLNFLMQDFEGFKSRFCEEIRAFAATLGLSIVSKFTLPADYIAALFKALPEDQQIVILIDEYDCGLTHNINNKTEYDKYLACLHQFYAVLKDCDQIRFLGITGVTRLKDVAIFSVGSNIKDVTYWHSMATLTGYTRREILKYFNEYVRDAVQKLESIELAPDSITADEPHVKSFMDRLAAEYDGYCFDEEYRLKVFSTWSVNCFFEKAAQTDRVKFGDYWFDNGGMPSILRNYLEKHDLDVSAYTAYDGFTPSPDDFLNPYSLLDISPTVLMCQTGYLTLRSDITEGDIVLGIPNREIGKALAKRLYFKYASRFPKINTEQRAALSAGGAESILELFNALFNTLSYENYPIRDEASLRSNLHCFFIGAGLNVIAERESARGRSDLELDLPSRRLVIELKYVENAGEYDQALDKALLQIKDRGYGNTLPLKKEVLRLGMVFDGSKSVRRFVRCRMV